MLASDGQQRVGYLITLPQNGAFHPNEPIEKIACYTGFKKKLHSRYYILRGRERLEGMDMDGRGPDNSYHTSFLIREGTPGGMLPKC